MFLVIRTTTNMFFNEPLTPPGVLNVRCWAEVKGKYTPEVDGNVRDHSGHYMRSADGFYSTNSDVQLLGLLTFTSMESQLAMDSKVYLLSILTTLA